MKLLVMAVPCLLLTGPLPAELFDRTRRQWQPLEWTLSNPTGDGNPFDLSAAVTFAHDGSGEEHTNGMFYAGGGR